jgi:hypothetical protein
VMRIDIVKTASSLSSSCPHFLRRRLRSHVRANWRRASARA